MPPRVSRGRRTEYRPVSCDIVAEGVADGYYAVRKVLIANLKQINKC